MKSIQTQEDNVLEAGGMAQKLETLIALADNSSLVTSISHGGPYTCVVFQFQCPVLASSGTCMNGTHTETHPYTYT